MISKQNDDLFDDDPIENLKIENEILKLKMKAEHGAHFFSEEEVPPEIEALFLHNVNEFEKAWENSRLISIHEFIGQPFYADYRELNPNQTQEAIDNILMQLTNKNIGIEKPSSIEPTAFYRFLTEEFFNQEIEDLQLEGFFRCFDYFEFHPDHLRDIQAIAERFLDNWFRKNIEGLKWDLDNIVLPQGPLISKDMALEILNTYFDPITVLTGGHFQIRDTKFEWDEENEKGKGHAEGLIFYETEDEYHGLSNCGGPFILYMANEYGYWSIYYLEIPGFAWSRERKTRSSSAD